MSLKNLILNRSGMGWIPDSIDKRDWTADLLGISHHIDLPRSFDLLNDYQVLNQGSTNSCVANAAAAAIMILETKAGVPVEIPSRLFMYFNARSLDSLQSMDRGATIRSLCKSLIMFGVPDEKYWPFSENIIKVNKRPDWNPFMSAYARKNGKYYKIQDFDDLRILKIQNAIHSGYPVIFGVKVAKSFLNMKGPSTISAPSDEDTIIGGHAVVAVGWMTIANSVYLRIVNSWGSDWRSGGTAYLHEKYIRSNLCDNFTIFTAWDKLRRER